MGHGDEFQHMVPVPMDMSENNDGIDDDEMDVGCTRADMGEAQDETPSSDCEGDSNDEEDSNGADLDRDSSNEHNNSKDSSDDDEIVGNFLF